MQSLKNTLRYLWISFKFDVKGTIMYPVSFWTTFITIPLWVFVQIVFIEVIYGQTDVFLSYTKSESYILFGTFKIVQSIGYFFFYHKLSDLQHTVRGDGEESFDKILLKPIDSQLLSTIGWYWFGSLSSVIVGIVLVVYGLSESIFPNSIQWITYIYSMTLGAVLLYILYLLIQTFVFWFENIESSEGLWEVSQEFGKYPSGLYRGSLGLVINLLIPLTLMGSIPSSFLLGKAPLYMLIIYTGIIVLLFLGTRLFWLYSIKKYSSFSS